jgi:hypothetical protein
MARWTCIVTALGLLGLVASPAAGSEAVARYRTEVSNQTLIGLSSIMTAPVDPFAQAIWPPDEFAELPGAVVTSHLMGFGSGVLVSMLRTMLGFTDVLLAPLPMLPVSPPLRFALTPGLVHEREEDPEWLCDMDGWGADEARSWGHRVGTVWCFPLGWKGSANVEE